jgi:RNA polymerase sigma factor (sigma-70 family)
LAIQDSLIVDQLKRESTLGVSNLVTKYQGFLYRWGRWHFEAINDQDLIQIVEDTFMRVIENIDSFQFRTDKGFKNWIITIFSRICLDHLRKAQRETERIKIVSFDNNPADGNNRAYNAVQLELDKKIFYDYLSPNTKEHPLAQKVRDFMEGLDENSRIILYACADGFPYREIANWVGMPVEHIKVYYSRLKKKLEKYLIETEGM